MAKTVNEVYARAKALMFEKSSSTIYDDYLYDNLNRILTELFEENNIYRVFKGKEKLTSPQEVSQRNDVLSYEDEYVNNVIPLGLAARFSIDDDLNKYSIFNVDYNNARVAALKIISQEKYDAA